MFTIEEWLPLLNKLVKLTRSSKVQWAVSYGLETSFICDVGNVVYEVGSVDVDGAAPYYFSVGDGVRELDRISTDSPEARSFDIFTSAAIDFEFPTAGQAIPELYRLANRAANGAADKAASLLDALSALDEDHQEGI